MENKKPKKEAVKRTIVSATNKEEKIIETKSAVVDETTAKVAQTKRTIKEAPKSSGNPTTLRILAVVFWLLGVGCEIFAILVLNGTINFSNPNKGTNNTIVMLIVALVVDMILVIIGSQFWKKANDIDPASEKNPIKFFLWNNMGVIASVIAFVPIIILMLRSDELKGKSKALVMVVAAIMLLTAGAASVDYNPASAEDLARSQDTISAIGAEEVFWTPFGRRYHLDPDCQTLMNSATIYTGTIEQAFEANRNTPCHFCATAMINIEDMVDQIEAPAVDSEVSIAA